MAVFIYFLAGPRTPRAWTLLFFVRGFPILPAALYWPSWLRFSSRPLCLLRPVLALDVRHVLRVQARRGSRCAASGVAGLLSGQRSDLDVEGPEQGIVRLRS
jgi:hypothetical protein